MPRLSVSFIPAALITAFLAVSSPVAHAQTPELSPAATPPAPPLPAVPQVLTRQVARGVDLIQEIIPASDPKGPLLVTILRVNPREKGVRIEAALGQDRVWGSDPTKGREIVSKLAARRGAVAGINGGFFPFAGNPIGLHVENGDLVTEPKMNRTVFGFLKDGTPLIEAFTYAGVVRAAGSDRSNSAVLNGVNGQPGKGSEILLYTPRFFNTTLKSAGRFEVVLSGVPGPLAAGREYRGTVAQTGAGGGATPLAKGTVVLSGGGSGADFLRRVGTPGATLVFRLNVTGVGRSVDPAKLRDAVAGGPRLLTDGRITIRLKEEGMGQSFSTTRHPRTAVGVARNGTLLFLTVDGRQTGLSRGASLTETAELLLKYGAVDAVNMDGGGSSVLTLRDAVANSPSSGAERAVANALLVYADDLPTAGRARALPPVLASPPAPLKVGETWAFAPVISGSAARPTGQEARWVWGTKGGIGFVSQDGVFRALRPGKGEVRVAWGAVTAASPGNKWRSVPVEVAGDKPVFTATLTLLPTDAPVTTAATLLIRVADAKGEALAGEIVAVTVIGGVADAPTVTTDARGEARMGITWNTTAATAAAMPPRSITAQSAAGRFTTTKITVNTSSQ